MRLLTFTFLSLLTALVSGHARIKTPKPLNAPAEDPTGNAYNAPLSATGSDFPCKNLHTQSGIDKTPTESWIAGSVALFEILGHVTAGEGALAAHSGGSCQASISFDNGRSFRVLHTYHGGCPRDVPYNSNLAGPNQTFTFSVPPQAKSGPALFSWTWIAVSGNRDEFYMDCAAVEITGSGTSTLDDYPNMYVGEMNIPGQIATGECRSTAGTALVYPDPGPADRVTVSEVAGIPFKAPTKGNCFAPGGKAPVSSVVASGTAAVPSSSSSYAAPVASTPSSYVAPVPSTPSSYVAPVLSTPSSYVAPVPSSYIAPTTTITTRTTTTVPAYIASPSAPVADPNTQHTGYTHPHHRITTTTTCLSDDAAPTDTTDTYNAPAAQHGGWKKRRHRNF
ncbi:hypothetical protein Q9L58_004037 [Maublancomyces gigas]|uniref:Lytic polysaccharide monooxygenase n=1 Tax=Discina gigas TaxID=1032678 RepID=A0ABR3GLZ0_9PEZI